MLIPSKYSVFVYNLHTEMLPNFFNLSNDFTSFSRRSKINKQFILFEVENHKFSNVSIYHIYPKY